MPIRDREIAAMQRVQIEFMPDRCNVLRPTGTRTIAGNVAKDFQAVYTNIPCEVTPKVLRQIVEHVGGGEIQSSLRWAITLPAGTLVKNDDRIEVLKTPVETYEVSGVQHTESYETAPVVQCLRVE